MDFPDFPDFGAFDYDESGFWLEPDTVLTTIVASMVNMLNIPVGVTLFVKGTVLTGMLVSEREYLKRLSETFKEMAKKNSPTQSEEEFRAIDEIFDFTSLEEGWYPMDHIKQAGESGAKAKAKPGKRKNKEADDVDDDLWDEDFDMEIDPPEMPIRHLHLTDVAVLSPSPPFAFGDGPIPLIRLRLRAIDGWMLGQTTPDEGDDDHSRYTGDSVGDSSEVLH